MIVTTSPRVNTSIAFFATPDSSEDVPLNLDLVERMDVTAISPLASREDIERVSLFVKDRFDKIEEGARKLSRASWNPIVKGAIWLGIKRAKALLERTLKILENPSILQKNLVSFEQRLHEIADVIDQKEEASSEELEASFAEVQNAVDVLENTIACT